MTTTTTKVRYNVTWREGFATDSTSFTDLEKAVAFARMKKNMLYADVKLEMLEIKELEF